MPYHICEVSSLEQEHHEASGSGDTYGPEHDSLKIRSKFPKEDLRPRGRLIYALLGIFYLPLVIDGFWHTWYGAIQPVDPNVTRKKSPFQDFLHSCDDCPLPIRCLCVGFPILIFGPEILFMLIPAYVLITSAFSILFHLVYYVLWDVRYFGNDAFSMRETIIYGEEVWEVSVGDTAKLRKFPKESPPFPFNLSQGDRIKVGFGPFEYWCLFRKQTQSDATARSPSPV